MCLDTRQFYIIILNFARCVCLLWIVHLCSMQEARGSTQAVTAPMVKQAWTTGSGWKSTAWTTSRTSVYLYGEERSESHLMDGAGVW